MKIPNNKVLKTFFFEFPEYYLSILRTQVLFIFYTSDCCNDLFSRLAWSLVKVVRQSKVCKLGLEHVFRFGLSLHRFIFHCF